MTVIRHECVGVSGWNWVVKEGQTRGTIILTVWLAEEDRRAGPNAHLVSDATSALANEPRTVGIPSLARRLISSSSRLTGRLGCIFQARTRPKSRRAGWRDGAPGGGMMLQITGRDAEMEGEAGA
jgi:hypothetical protein